MIKRECIVQLQQWRNSPYRKPLIIRGARQVGKTTVIKEFGKQFPVFLSLNLDKEADRALFDRYTDVHQLVDAIFMHFSHKREEADTLLFIDEIQSSPAAMHMLRYFKEEMPQLFVIAAGSLLETVIDRDASFPVGRVEFLAMHPCSFLEYLNAIGDDFDAELVTGLKADVVHDRLLAHFKNYCIVGGMPEALQRYATSRDLLGQDDVYESLIASYNDDVEKYARTENQVKAIRAILEQGWSQGGAAITYENFGGTGYKSREMSDAFRIIQKAMLLELVRPTQQSTLPIISLLNRKPKLIWLDTGLVSYMAGVRKEIFSVEEITDAWRGHIGEQIVAQELIAHDPHVTTHRNFWVGSTRNSTAEVDFVVRHDANAIPIEVKTGTHAHLKSLHVFMSQAPHDLAVRVWSKPLQLDTVDNSISHKPFRLLSIPYYYVGVLQQLLNKYL